MKMNKNNIFRKGMILGVIILFVGAGVIPSISSNSSITGIRNSYQSTVSVDSKDDGCYNHTEVWDRTTNPHGESWYNDYENHTDDIREAIDLVCENGTVYVHSGNYYTGEEFIRIDKPLNFIGEDKNNTIINGTGHSESVITVESYYVNITGFTISECKWVGAHTQAGVRVITPSNVHPYTIRIFNNSIRNNTNGIYVTTLQYSSNLSCIEIFKNDIWDNLKDGIIIFYGMNNSIYKNKIYNNGESGIDLWYANDSVIDSNNIYNNTLDGIWNDMSGNNIIIDNIIRKNTRNGITFYFSGGKEIYKCENNEVIGNVIESNKGGILIYYANSNSFYNNTIKNNTEFGFKIQQIVDVKDFNTRPTSTDNEIYKNNFINNGKPRRIVNAVDSMPNSGNYWFDRRNDSGNYWSDYVFDEEGYDRNRTWDKPYGLCIQLFWGYYLCSKWFSVVCDNFPWCRKNGWKEVKAPYQPCKPEGDDLIYVGQERTYTSRTTDPNGDQIYYQWDWGDEISDWSEERYDSGDECSESHSWSVPGNYNVRVRAKDFSILEYDLGGTDGNSSWSLPLEVKVY